jgi:glycosyltransferase involved in cell wall biosynthesis
MVEALACGTPVIALDQGSVPEVIQDGVTGFICSNEEEMVAAVGRLGELDRARCRAEAERRFSPSAMAAAYEQLYARLLKQPDALCLPVSRRDRVPEQARLRQAVGR